MRIKNYYVLTILLILPTAVIAQPVLTIPDPYDPLNTLPLDFEQRRAHNSRAKMILELSTTVGDVRRICKRK